MGERRRLREGRDDGREEEGREGRSDGREEEGEGREK